MNKYYVDFKLTVSTARVIAADSEEEALAIAEKMIRDDDYWYGTVVQAIDDDCENWCSDECEVFVLDTARDTYEADNEL
jgi:hypothetical protein